jgi:hypothetical protein
MLRGSKAHWRPNTCQALFLGGSGLGTRFGWVGWVGLVLAVDWVALVWYGSLG